MKTNQTVSHMTVFPYVYITKESKLLYVNSAKSPYSTISQKIGGSILLGKERAKDMIKHSPITIYKYLTRKIWLRLT